MDEDNKGRFIYFIIKAILVALGLWGMMSIF